MASGILGEVLPVLPPLPSGFRILSLMPRVTDNQALFGGASPSIIHQTDTVEMEAVGRTATLHRVPLRRSLPVDSFDPHHVAERLSGILDIQMRRQAASIRLGLPIDVPVVDIGHILCDRLSLRFDTDIPRRLRMGVQELIVHGHEAHMDNVTTGGIDIEASADGNPCANLQSGRPWGIYSGRGIAIDGTFPDTMLTAMVGRRVGEIVEHGGIEETFAPMLDRIVTGAANQNGMLILRFAPDLIPISEADIPR